MKCMVEMSVDTFQPPEPETGQRAASRAGKLADLRDYIPPMPQSTAERQRAFKEAMKQAGYVRLEAYVTKEQRDKFRQIGGDEWLRKKIEAAKQKTVE